MQRQIVRIAPWQATKLSAILYFALGVIVAVPIGVIGHFATPVPGQPPPPGLWFAISISILYGLAGLIFVPLGCWLYNTVAARIGGLSIVVEDDPRG